MPLIQGGPPEWSWERTPDPMKWEVVPAATAEREAVYELKVHCGLEIWRLQFFTEEELKELQTQINVGLRNRESIMPADDGRAKSPEHIHFEREPGINPEPEPGNRPDFATR